MTEQPRYALRFKVPYDRLRKLGRTANRKAFGSSHRLAWLVRIFILALAAAMLIWPHEASRIMFSIPVLLGLSPERWGWLPIAMIIALFVGGLALARQRYHREIQASVDFDQEASLAFEDEGIRIASADIEYFIRWRGIHQVMIEPDGIAFNHAGLVFFVPDEAFADAGQRRDFVRDLFEMLPEAVRQRSEKEVRHVIET